MCLCFSKSRQSASYAKALRFRMKAQLSFSIRTSKIPYYLTMLSDTMSRYFLLSNLTSNKSNSKNTYSIKGRHSAIFFIKNRPQLYIFFSIYIRNGFVGGVRGSCYFSIFEIRSWSLFRKTLNQIFIPFLITNFRKFSKKLQNLQGCKNQEKLPKSWSFFKIFGAFGAENTSLFNFAYPLLLFSHPLSPQCDARYICTYICIYVYICIYIEREKDWDSFQSWYPTE